MSRSIKKGPFVAPELMKRVEEMNEMKLARAEHKYARISPRKVEIVCNMIRGKDAKLALALLENTPTAG